MKYSGEVYIGALKALAALREAATEGERATIDFIAEAIAEKGGRDKDARSNAGKIRAMSDEELAGKCLHLMGAERITVNPAGGGYHIFFGPDGRVMPHDEAFRAWTDWLRQPAEEENHG